MKKIVFILFLLLFPFFVHAQSKGIILESINNDKTNDYISLSYERELDVRYDKEYGKYYNSLYFVNGYREVISVAIANYKNKGIIEVYIYPYYFGKRVDDLLKVYIIKSSDFKGLKYVEDYEFQTDKKKIELEYISDKKEHIRLKQIDSQLFNLHYKIVK